MAGEYRKSLDFLVKVAHAANEPRKLSKCRNPFKNHCSDHHDHCTVKQHPYWLLFISLLVFLGPWILLLPLFLMQAAFVLVLNIIGFGAAGITEGKP